MRDPCARADLCALRHPYRWPRAGEGRRDVLLRALCRTRRRARIARPGVGHGRCSGADARRARRRPAHGEETLESGPTIRRPREASWRSLCVIEVGERSRGARGARSREETLTADDRTIPSSDEADATGVIVALPARHANHGAPVAAADEDADALAQQLCEQVHELQTQALDRSSGANVVWLFR